jgi:hypothetical protein
MFTYTCEKTDRSNCNIRKIKQGENFANLARELSVHKANAKRGRDLGLFGRSIW